MPFWLARWPGLSSSSSSILVLLLCLFLVILSEAAVSESQEICYPDSCTDPDSESFFSYQTCCDNDCCSKLRFWVYPAGIAAMGFVAGAFFALCFQCR